MDKTTKRVIGYKPPVKEVAAVNNKPRAVMTCMEKAKEIAIANAKANKPVSSTTDLVESFTAKLQQQQKEHETKLEALTVKNEKLREEVRSLKEGPKTKPATAGEVVSWINNHPMFKYAQLCDEIGFDRGQFCRILKSKEPSIKPEVVAKIEAVIKEYGFRA